MKQDQPEQSGFLGLRLLAVTLLALGLVALYYTFQIQQGAGYSVVGTLFFPLVVVIGLVGLSLILLLRTTPLIPDHELRERAAAEARYNSLENGRADGAGFGYLRLYPQLARLYHRHLPLLPRRGPRAGQPPATSRLHYWSRAKHHYLC